MTMFDLYFRFCINMPNFESQTILFSNPSLKTMSYCLFISQLSICLIQQFYKMSSKTSNIKRKYDRISYDNRIRLIEMVQKQGQTIKNAAKILDIKQSTAKLIVSRFRTSGTIYETQRDLVIRSAVQRQLKMRKTKVLEDSPTVQIKIEYEEIKDQTQQATVPSFTNLSADACKFQPAQLPFYYHFMPPIYFPL